MLLYHDIINLNWCLLCINFLYAFFTEGIIPNLNFKGRFTDLLYLFI